jgi:hypothetical protein
MTRPLRTLVALLALTVPVALMLSPADAESGGKDYKPDNAPAAIDLTRLHVTNAERRFEMRVEVQDLGDRGRFHFHYWAGRHGTPPARSALVVVRRLDGATESTFFVCGREDCVPAPCGSLTTRWRPRADVVAVSARQRCFPGSRTPDTGRFFAWARTHTHVDPGASPLPLARG